MKLVKFNKTHWNTKLQIFHKYFILCIAVHCPAGTYAGEKQQQCTHCPRGFYQNRDRQGSCIRCPMGTYTREEGRSYYKIAKMQDSAIYQVTSCVQESV